MMEKKTEGSRTPYRSSRKHDRANEKQVLPYKKRVLCLGSNDTQKVSQSETSCATYISRQSSSSDTKFSVEKNKSEIHPSKKISSSTTFDKDEVSASVSLLELRDPSGKLPLAMPAGNEAHVQKSQGDKIPVKGPRSIRIRFGNHRGSIRRDLPPQGDGVSKDDGSGVGDTKQADKTKVIENDVGDDRSNGKEPLGDGHGRNGTPGAVGDRKKANDARSTVGKGIQTNKGKGVMKQEGDNGKSTGSEPQGDNNGSVDGSPVFVDGKQTDNIKEVIEYEGGRGGGNSGSEPADDAKDDELGTITGDGKTASKRKDVIENKVGGSGSTRCEPQGDNDCKDGTTSVVGERKQAEKIKVIEHGGGGFLPIEMAVKGMNAGICEGGHEKQELTEKEDGGSEDNSNSAPGEEQSNKDKDLLEDVVSTTVYANEPDVVEHGKRVNLADHVTNIEGSSSRLPADGTLTQSLVLEDGSCLSPADSTDERDKNGNSKSSFDEQGQVVAVEDASDDKNNRNMEPGREEETIEGKTTVDDIVSTKVRDEVEPEGGQDGRGNETDMIIGEEKTHEADSVKKLVDSGGDSPADTTIKTRNDDNIEDLNEQKKNLTEDGGNEGGVINELVEQDKKGKNIVDRHVVSTIIDKAGSGIKEPEGGHDCNNNPPDVGNEGKLMQADQVTNSAGCGGNAPPTNFTLGRGSDANTEGNHEERIRKASFLLPDGGRGTDSSVAPAGGTPSRYIVNSSGYNPAYGISNIQMLQDAKTISSGRKRTHNSHDHGEVSQDRGGGDAVGQKGRKKYKDGSNEVSGINSNATGCNELPDQQASHTFRLFGVDIDVPERESTISHVRGGHGGGESSMKKHKSGLRLMGYDIELI